MSETSDKADTFALRAGLTAAVALFVATELLFRHGFDFTDEASYLLSMDRPREYATLHTLYQFVCRPLYLALGGNVALLRAFWFAIMFVAALALCRSFVSAVWTGGLPPPRTVTLTLPFTLATAGTASFLTLWLPTPNYNSLNFLGICLFATGFIDLHSSVAPQISTRPSGSRPSARHAGLMAPQLMMAFGVWLSFMGRAYTAPALMLIALVAAFPKKDFRPLLLPAIVAAGLLFLTSLWTDGSPLALLERFLEANRERGLFGTHNRLMLLTPGTAWTARYLAGPFTALFLVLFIWGFALTPGRDGRTLRSTIALGVPAAGLAVLIFTRFPYELFGWAKTVAGHHLWAAPCGAYLRSQLNAKQTAAHGGPEPGLTVPIGLLAMTFAYPLGSNNPLLNSTSSAALFMTLAFLALLSGRVPAIAWPSLLARLAWTGVLVAGATVYCSAGHPYRQDAELWNQRSPATLPDGGGILYLSERRARYVDELQSEAKAAGFRQGDPVIDLTGQHPGSSYAIGGFMPKSLWITSAYPGSRAWLSIGLSKLTCDEIARSWLFVDLMPMKEPLDDRLLLKHGTMPSADYRPVAKALFAEPVAPGYLYLEDHRLMKPTRNREEATEACRLARAAGAQAGETVLPGL
ncbi:MAG: hypothetical protein LBT40_01245 [Deltaproteobacteria bacterium]|jgi:hypothetical protein|nr:hypothetical protein [Deltaproteobacteria bacterium]